MQRIGLVGLSGVGGCKCSNRASVRLGRLLLSCQPFEQPQYIAALVEIRRLKELAQTPVLFGLNARKHLKKKGVFHIRQIGVVSTLKCSYGLFVIGYSC